MASYILLDLNGTVGTDFPDILEKLENPDNFIWVEKVQAHIKLSTLKRIKELSETYLSPNDVGYDLDYPTWVACP